jgi:hypothetical protein
VEPLATFGKVEFTIFLSGHFLSSFVLDLRKLNSRLEVVAIIDPNTEQTHAILQQKSKTSSAPAYKNTRVFKKLDDFIKEWPLSGKRLHGFMIATPSFFRGTMQPGRDIEMQIMRYFPTVPMFVEVPLSFGPMTEVDEVFKVAKRITNSGTICSIGFAALNFSGHVS